MMVSEARNTASATRQMDLKIRFVNPVANATDGTDVFAAGTQLRAQCANMDIHGAGLAKIVGTPDLFQQLVPGIDPAGVLQEDPQQFEFLQCQLNARALHPDGVGVGEHFDIPQPQGLTVFDRGRPAEYRLDAGHHFHHGEGLCQVIIRAQIQTHDFVILSAPGGGHDDGDLFGGGRGAERLQDLNAVHVGQHHVQCDELGLFVSQSFKQAFAVCEAFRFEAGRPEGVEHQLPDGVVVFYTVDHKFLLFPKGISKIYKG